MSDQGIKSRPAYGKITGDPAARHALLVVEGAGLPDELMAEGVDPSAFETWTVAHASTVPGAPVMDEAAGAVRPFRSARQLFSALEERLARETMGLRLCAAGTEPFLWDVFNIGAVAGLTRQEMQFAQMGPQARRIFCVHCRTVSEGITASIVTCAGCGASLFVRDHFSKRLAAFMAVQIDAEVPGEVPPSEEIYR
ncbi:MULTISPECIES: dimethylamine monooxygenase subunit DmmA family protein [unclassified Xanthobacter]|uniref:dimethylamine monooxygenase subunit DmmA family protein n=1 Tax=unclassified Xanthobacter TaxID=2623496 RepID=UPI001EE153C7|nr:MULTISPECIES: dimethylamine monooxygenase subunit DmmA family protein [unclassified Xanthobacter]